MTPEKKKALTIIAAGIAFSLVAFLINAVLGPGPRLAQMLSLAISFGGVIVVIGCIMLARAKGRPWFFGLLGLFSCLGVAVLWFLVPDQKA
jgi:Na+/melibiose symporter-like transporter